MLIEKLPISSAAIMPQKANGNTEIPNTDTILPFEITEELIFMDGTQSLAPVGSTIQAILIRYQILLTENGFSNGDGPTKKRLQEVDTEITQFCESLDISRQDGTLPKLERDFTTAVRTRARRETEKAGGHVIYSLNHGK